MLRRLRERLVDGHEDEVLAELADRHAPEAEKVATWRRYLVAYPNGRAASKAHWRLAEAALRADRDAEAEERLQRLLASFPERAEADAALVRLGRRFLDA